MNDASLDGYLNGWFPVTMTVIALVQTGILVLACWLMCEWFSKLNRKLHRIESNTRHTVEAVSPEGAEAA